MYMYHAYLYKIVCAHGYVLKQEEDGLNSLSPYSFELGSLTGTGARLASSEAWDSSGSPYYYNARVMWNKWPCHQIKDMVKLSNQEPVHQV